MEEAIVLLVLIWVVVKEEVVQDIMVEVQEVLILAVVVEDQAGAVV